MSEFPKLINALCQYVCLPMPPQLDIWYLMFKNDINQDGKISYDEFMNMMKEFGTSHSTNQQMQTDHGQAQGYGIGVNLQQNYGGMPGYNPQDNQP